MPSTLENLMADLDFDLEDLEANRRGRLSEKQLRRVKGGRWADGLQFGCTAFGYLGLCAFFPGYFFARSLFVFGEGGAWWLRILAGAVGVAAVAGLFFAIFAIVMERRGNREIRAALDEDLRDGGVYQSEAVVQLNDEDQEHYAVTEDANLFLYVDSVAVEPGDHVTVYYLKHAHLILSIEPK